MNKLINHDWRINYYSNGKIIGTLIVTGLSEREVMRAAARNMTDAANHWECCKLFPVNAMDEFLNNFKKGEGK